MIGAASEIVGRDAELREIETFVADVRLRSAALVVTGDPGIGKTTVWERGVAFARGQGHRVLVTSPVAGETALSFSGLADLLGDALDDVVTRLPPPLARALGVALLLEDDRGSPPERRAVAAACLGALRELGRQTPVIVAVDDVQWLDHASAAALTFAARRLGDSPVGFLLSQRVAPEEDGLAEPLPSSFAADRLLRLSVRPLTLGALQRVLHLRAGATFPRSIHRRIHEVSGGNPFYALEIARVLERRGEAVSPADPLPVPGNLEKLLKYRIAALPSESRSALEVAALTSATVDLVEKVLGNDPLPVIESARANGVVDVIGERIAFTHPLLASAVSSAMPRRRRSELHRRLAEAVDDPELRARHLALAAEAPSNDTAVALDAAAEAALSRGAPAAAAELAEHARRLTPADDPTGAVRRSITAAAHHFEAGDGERARTLLEEAIASPAAGQLRAEALVGLARVHTYEADLRNAAELFAQAAAESHDRLDVRAEAEHGLAATHLRMLDNLAAAARHAAAAVALAEERRDGPALAAYLGTQGLIEALRGDPRAQDLLDRAAELEAADEPSGRRAPAAFLRVLRGGQFMRGVVATFTEDLPIARAELDAAREETSSLGDESSLPLILRYLSDVELVAGNWLAAEAAAGEGYEAAVQTGQPAQQAALAGSRALVAAHLGQSSAARRWAAEAFDVAETTGAAFGRVLGTSALGLLELSEGRAREAAELLAPLTEWADEAGLGEPGARRFVADAVEALLLLGDFDEAERLLDAHERRARELGRTVTSGSAARCRALLFAARGDPVRGIACIEEVRASGALVPAPFERARMLLALGAVHRRARHKRAAREALEESQSVFERLGAALWAKRARAELARVGGRAPSRGALTPTERRVAALVAEGGSTKEVAAALVVSGKTVEGHLSRIYAKLGVRSRAELARRLSNKAV